MIKKLLFILTSLVFFIPYLFLLNHPAYADQFQVECSVSYQPGVINRDTPEVTVVIDTHGQAAGSNYQLAIWQANAASWNARDGILTASADNKITAKISNIDNWLDESGKQIQVNLLAASDKGIFNENIKCPNKLIIPVNISSSGSTLCSIDFKDETYTVDPESEDFDPTKFMRPGNSIKATVGCPDSNKSSLFCQNDAQTQNSDTQVFVKNDHGGIISAYKKTVGELKSGFVLDPVEQGHYLLDVQVPIPRGILETLFTQAQYFECSKGFNLDSRGGGTGCSSDDDCLGNPSGRYCLPNKTGELSCQNNCDDSGPNAQKCLAINPCVSKGNDYICQTAIGAIGTSAGKFAESVIQLILGLAGLVLLFMIILNGYKFMTSQGDPEKVKEARESITAAVAGILLIIFSIVVLQLITVDVLHLPGFKP